MGSASVGGWVCTAVDRCVSRYSSASHTEFYDLIRAAVSLVGAVDVPLFFAEEACCVVRA